MSNNVPPNLGGKDTRGQVPPIQQFQGKVRAVHQDEVHVDVGVGSGSMQVPLLPGSRIPRAGDAVMVLGDRTGAVGLVLRNHKIFWNFTTILPYTPPDALTGPPCKIVAWKLEATAIGNLVVDIRLGDRAGPSICGATMPTLAAQRDNGGILTLDDGWQRNVGLDGSDVDLYFVVLEDPPATVVKYRIVLYTEVR